MVRTAAVVGTATATRGAVNRRQADKNAKAAAQATNTYVQETQPPPQQVVYAAPPEAAYVEAAPAPEVDTIGQLERLGALKAQGILTEEEFAAQKAKLLAG
jgi:hypothetical protein